MDQADLVFGYGSLTNVQNLQKYLGRSLNSGLDFVFCSLPGFRRCWNVAMDNSIDLPDYKYYIIRQTKQRPSSFVTFLNIRSCQESTIVGILFYVSQQELKVLDRRERNYQRVNVTNLVDTSLKGTAWTYIGLERAKKRYFKGLNQQNAMISRDYFNLVQDAYTSCGKEVWQNYLTTTDLPQVPQFDLEVCRFV